MTIQEIYKQKQDEWKSKIRSKPKHRWLHWLWYLIAFPFVWLWYNIRDWKSAVCVVISLLLWSASVWVWYLLALLTGWTTDAAKWFLGIGSAIWVWWLSPVGSPFILLVTMTAIGMKMLYDKIIGWRGIIKSNGGCYVRMEDHYEWYEWHKPFICRGYICLKPKKRYILIIKNKGDIIYENQNQ